MAEELIISTSLNKKDRYETLIPQINALVGGEKDLVANLANISSALYHTLGFFWVGFYLVKENSLVLAPFQGPVACTRIARGKGVCGTAWERKETIIVPDVEQFPGHIACSSLSKSEIVVPIFNTKKEVIGVLDVDSDKINDFDELDRQYLQEVVTMIERSLEKLQA